MTQKKQNSYKSSKSGPNQKPMGLSSKKSRKPGLRGVHRKPEKVFDFHEADDRIYDIFKHHGFGDYPHEKRHQLVRFYQLLMTHQQSDNVTRLLKLRDIAIKHFIDCLMVTRLIKLTFPVLDMGTGPGFPGIPLKIHFPDEPMVLVEGVEKRVQFLKTVRENLGLQKLDLIGRYVTPQFNYPVPTVITRAVAKVSDTLGQVINCLPSGGQLVLMKGPHVGDELMTAMNEWKAHYKLIKDHYYEIPSTPHQRRLVVIEKK